MNKIKEFCSGYIKTILFAIEYKHRFQFPQELFIIPHFLHHVQLLSLFLERSSDQAFDYVVVLAHFSLFEPMLTDDLSKLFLFLIFAFQIILLFYLLIATFETQRVSLNFKLRLILEKKIESVSSVLHWYFTFYNIFTIPIIVISVKFMLTNYYIFAYFNAILQYFQGIILIYLLRNHRFAENNSFKRKFAYVQFFNYTIAYLLIFFRFYEEIVFVKYALGFSYAILQIVDQFYSCPYRDPFREPSLKVAMVLLSSIFICLFFSLKTIVDGQLFWILFVAALMSGVSASISSLFHEFAMTNYNSRFNLQEKYIIIGVDQFYSHFTYFQTSEYNKLTYFQQLIKHNENCMRPKCPSQKSKLSKVNFNDNIQLQKLTIDVVSCIFKTCHSRTVIKNGEIHKPKFEQLQLQYISFLSSIAQRPLIGYVELRKYQQDQNNDNSLYFRELTSKISAELEFAILYLQERMILQQFRKEKYMAKEEKLTIAQLWRKITPHIIDVIDKKQRFWDNLLEGYDDLEPFHNEQLQLCKSIDQLYKKIKTSIIIPEVFFDRSKDISLQTVLKTLDPEDRNINILNLKIYSILYAVILNDFDRAFQAEKQIEDLIKEDRQKSIEIIDDCALLKDDAAIILVSLVRKKGHIVNKNLLTLANFFEFQNVQDIAGQTLISSFLPPDLRILHDAQLNEFISKGFTKYSVQSIHSYYLQKQGYLRECYIKLGNLFQDSSDFILTGSILRLQTSYDVIMFDGYGKIIGTSQEFFDKRILPNNPSMTMERFVEQGNIIMLMPFILINLKKLANETQTDFVDYSYFPEQLLDICLQFGLLFDNKQKYDQRLSSYNLTTIKSQQASHMTAISSRSYGNSEEQVKIKGQNIPMLQVERMNLILDFLLKYHNEQSIQCDILKIKYSIEFQVMETKKNKYPYFILKLEPLNEFERSDSCSIIPYKKSIRRTLIALKYGESQTGVESTNTKNFTIRNFQQNQDQLNETADIKGPSDQHLLEQIMQISNISISKPQKQQDDLKVVFENPQISRNEDEDFQQLDQDVEESKIDVQKPEQELFEDPKYDSDLIEKKSDSSKGQKTKKKSDILEILRKNINNQEVQEHEHQQSSKPSSTKTSSSKSPYLLIRTLYQIGEIDSQIWVIIMLNIFICLIALILVFIKIFIVQNQFGILQANLNYVQYPEKINNYFLKSLMFSSNILQQKLELVTYSQFVNDALKNEFSNLALKIEYELKSIYEDIITFENQVVSINDDLKVINNLKQFEITFDLTILLEQISSNSINLNLLIQNEKELEENFLSLNLFFKLNMVQVITVSKSYINYLNDNLIFYEQQIVNILIYVIVAELSIITVFMFFIIKVLQDVNQLIRKILILITKLSEDDVNQINRIYQEIKTILKDPKQVQWKQTNFVKCIFETNFVKAKQDLNYLQSSNGSEAAKNNKQKFKKRYQNSSLTSRVYNLRLPQIWNYAFIFLSWLFLAGYLLGALGLSLSMVHQIKPAITLNLQLIEFKLKFDSLIVYGEILKTDYLVNLKISQLFELSQINFNQDGVKAEFFSLQEGFQDQLSVIYDQLQSSTSLLDEQKNTLLVPFRNSLCESDPTLVPACTNPLETNSSDNSLDYLSGGIVNMVHEFSKTLKTFWQLNDYAITDENQLEKFLSGQVHTTEFVHHFLFQGKIMEQIANTMLNLNKSTLDSVILKFQIYMYILGLTLIIVYTLCFYKWILKLDNEMYLTKLALTLIPADFLNEQKTMSDLKNIQNE
ncbi:unnamed protein product (macronuclear) [Paramecium tetraurelia]|uniref:Transmembrane protein n=1 Tax=Paramecium tetraurelia TaxID=5888 RepID=A0CKF2_PARTE|nr:uncharacterized protein GSPATT00000983001 [Paramecium tetraurelia]CAK71269.1 unnamed protein product [Paramecium tetraurelia]|eukprot:XP_001438666.1 hypothetical protein (macronuclear) [Paramecium tetraurelia strain d4-2]